MDDGHSLYQPKTCPEERTEGAGEVKPGVETCVGAHDGKRQFRELVTKDAEDDVEFAVAGRGASDSDPGQDEGDKGRRRIGDCPGGLCQVHAQVYQCHRVCSMLICSA